MGRRLGGLFVDCVLAALVTSPFVHVHLSQPNYWSLLTWFLITVIGTALFGMTPGMVLFGLRVVRLDGQPMVGVWRAVIRAVLVALILPAVIWDADHRGLQDKAADTMVLTTRSRA